MELYVPLKVLQVKEVPTYEAMPISWYLWDSRIDLAELVVLNKCMAGNLVSNLSYL